MKKNIVFNADELIQAVEDVRNHVVGKKKLTMRTTRVALPPKLTTIKAREISALRKRLNVSQPVFARMLNVPVVTAASWEKGRRHPSGAALRLIQIARTHPKLLLQAAR